MTDRLKELFERADGAFVSGEEISAKLAVSRTAVWKQIERLRKDGYVFEAVPRKGYRLLSAPERLDAVQVMTRLATQRFGRRLHYLDEVDSTQVRAKQLIAEGAPEGTLVVAELQTAGRGRLGRSWHSPKGKGLWLSLALKPEGLPLSATPQLTLLVAVALCRSIRQLTGVEAVIKWPNDLLVDGKKAAGILLEASAENGSLQHIIAGVGIGVNLTSDDYPEELRETAISLGAAAGHHIDRSALLCELMKEWETLYDLYLKEGFQPIRLLWEALTVSLHRPIRCRTAQGDVEGFAEGIDEQGALLLRLSDGTVRKMYSADVDFR